MVTEPGEIPGAIVPNIRSEFFVIVRDTGFLKTAVALVVTNLCCPKAIVVDTVIIAATNNNLHIKLNSLFCIKIKN
jgi:hypothetical protein